jgi:glycosyltransferase involved in cell wall biosynthesis
MCITEWYQPFQYKGGILNPVYWLDELGFQKGIPMSKSVLPISRKLESFFKSKGCKTLCLPILANPPEIITGTNYNKQVIDFIYSGNAVKKDAIDMVIKSFARLSDEELRKVRLHFTGMGQNTISYLQRKCGMDYKRIEPILTIHTWMQYEDLITLYQKMDFLVLLRRINKVTLSNFPSKVPEMMGYGVIPVVSKVGDYTEEYLADGKDCIMINGCNEAEAVKGIRRALSMSAEERNNMRHNAHETVENKFLYSLWSDKIEDFLYGE